MGERGTIKETYDRLSVESFQHLQMVDDKQSVVLNGTRCRVAKDVDDYEVGIDLQVQWYHLHRHEHTIIALD